MMLLVKATGIVAIIPLEKNRLWYIIITIAVILRSSAVRPCQKNLVIIILWQSVIKTV